MALAAVLAAALAACSGKPAAPPDVVLIVMDTVRADHLGVYGYERPTTPGLDRAARNALIYDAAVATAPMTMPSVAALLTGRYGDRVGVSSHSRRDRLVESTVTLAEAAHQAGYRTIAAVANPWLARADAGFAQGFDRYLTRGSITTKYGGRLRADAVTDAALEAVAEDATRPLLLWVHYIDAHMPYSPPPTFATAMGNDSATSEIVNEFKRPGADLQAIYFENRYAPEQVAATVQLYDGAIRFIDDQIARLRAGLARRGRPTLIVVTADHGESLGDHALYFAHDFTLYEELIRVPLLIELPGATPRRVPEPVSLIDVFPTVCALTPIVCPGDIDGTALAPAVVRRDDPEQRVVYAAGPPKRQRYARDPFIRLPGFAGRWTMARSGFDKMIRVPTPDGESLRAFDLASDTGERDDVLDADRHAALHAALDRWRDEMDTARAVARPPAQPIDDETREGLRELGYVD